jgi:hypothetical protein
MSDLDEREQSVDDMLRAAALRLHDELARSAVPDTLRRHSRRSNRWILAIVLVVVVVLGLIGIGTYRNDESLGNDPGRLRWLVRDLPEGWRAVEAADSRPLPGSMPLSMTNLYADATSSGPVIAVIGADVNAPSTGPSAVQGLHNYEELTIEGRRTVLADTDTGKEMFVEVDDRWISLRTRGLGNDEVRRLAGGIVVHADGTAAVTDDRLPADMTLVARAGEPLGSELSVGFGFRGAYSVYRAADPSMQLILIVDRVHPADFAWLRLSMPLTSVDVDGSPGWIATRDAGLSTTAVESRTIYWERDGLAFTLNVIGVDEAGALTAARSVTPASEAEWSSLGGGSEANPATSGTEAPAGTVPAEPGVGLDTIPPFTGVPHDAETDVSVTTPSANEQIWSGHLPSGDWSVRVVRVFDDLSLWVTVGGQPRGMITGPLARAAGQEIHCCPINVVTANTDAVALRVVANDGARYIIPLHDLPGATDLRIAVLGLADGVSSAELIDADGNVLESMP